MEGFRGVERGLGTGLGVPRYSKSKGKIDLTHPKSHFFACGALFFLNDVWIIVNALKTSFKNRSEKC